MATQKPLPPILISSFSLIDIETALNIEADELVKDKNYKIYQHIIFIKPLIAYIKKIIYYLANFGEITSQTIKAILEGLTTQYLKDVIKAIFKYKITYEIYKLKKKIATPDIISIDSTLLRRHRTLRLQEQLDIRREFIYLAGNY